MCNLKTENIAKESEKTRSEIDVEEEMLCDICGDVYEQPKVLACFHSFCAKCLTIDEQGLIIFFYHFAFF